MNNIFLEICHLNLSYQQQPVLRDLSWQINRGENWVLTGISGSGKITLAKIIVTKANQCEEIKINFDLASKHPAKAVFVESWYQFKNLEGVANFYYQQRYNSKQTKDVSTVHADLLSYGKENGLHFRDVEPILEALSFSTFAGSQLIELSSGEHKKITINKSFVAKTSIAYNRPTLHGFGCCKQKKTLIVYLMKLRSTVYSLY